MEETHTTGREIVENAAKHTAHEDVEVAYSGLERLGDRPCYCYGSGVVILGFEDPETGELREESAPCRRC